MRRWLLAVVLSVVAVSASTWWPASDAAAPDTTPPNGRDQAPQDGCQRNAVGLLTFTSPEWVYVRKDEPGDHTSHFIEGTVAEDSSHPAPGGGDLPEGHEWYDFNGDIQPPPGSPYAYQTGAGPDGPYPTLHTERESGQIPTAAWMTAGDHAAVWGSWIWDCGHWGNGLDFSKPANEANRDYFMPGQSLPGDTGKDVGGGESTEFHPVKAYAITRSNPYAPPVEQTETDFYVSNYGTTAHAEEVCAAGTPEIGFAHGPDYTACLQDPRNRHWQINDTDYTFFIPAPPVPPGVDNPALRVTMADNPGSVGPQPTPILDVRPDGVQVTIPMTAMPDVPAVAQCPVAETSPQHSILPPYDCPSQAVSKVFFVGWEGDVQRIPAELKLTLKSVTVHHSLDVPGLDTSSQQPPGEYGVNMDANGMWLYVNDLQTGLDQVYGDKDPGGDGQGGPLAIDKSYVLRVKDGGRVRLFFPTRECDLPHMNPCFATPEVAEDNDGPGDAKVVFGSVDAAVGDHVIEGGDPGDPNWELSYSIAKVADARVGSPAGAGPPGGPIGGQDPSTYPNAGGPGSGEAGSNQAGAAPQGAVLGDRSGCADTYSPLSRFRGRDGRPGIRATRRGVRMHGRAGDRNCRGKPGTVARVEVAIARRVGSRCSFMDAHRRFGAARRCTPQSFLRAHGTGAWRFSRRVVLRRGRYLAFSRAIDPAGNVEYRARPGNRARFSVR